VEVIAMTAQREDPAALAGANRVVVIKLTGRNDTQDLTPTPIGRAFALGQAVIDDPSTYSFDCNLNIFADPLEWLRAKRDGIVVLPNKWLLTFDRLRDVPRVAIVEQLLPLYRRHMKPSRLPELMILPERRQAA
jgi:hypothetical protein